MRGQRKGHWLTSVHVFDVESEQGHGLLSIDGRNMIARRTLCDTGLRWELEQLLTMGTKEGKLDWGRFNT